MRKINIKYKTFTLVEMLMVLLILGLIMPSMFTLISFMTKTNKEISLRQTAIQQGYEFFERLNVLLQDYTIDYEEYYNRKMVGCVGAYTKGPAEFEWNIGKEGYCSNFTAYGNKNSTDRGGAGKQNLHDIYYCSSVITSILVGNLNGNGSIDTKFPKILPPSFCGLYTKNNQIRYQSFGQYAALFIDVKDAVSIAGKYFGDVDDRDTGKSPVDAIGDPENIQELYLISHDGTRRLFLRRKLINEQGKDKQYKIQMLRLRGFDAGQNHNFAIQENNTFYEGVYDGNIDTWACDASLGFDCCKADKSNSIGGAYEKYCIPEEIDDGRIDLTQGGTTMKAWNIKITPVNDPVLYWAEESKQINPMVQIFTDTGIYRPYYDGMLLSESIRNFSVPVQTSFNMKDFYKN